MHKSNNKVKGKCGFQTYSLGGNYIYTFFVLDQACNLANFHGELDDFMALAKTALLCGCYMFCEANLITTGYISPTEHPGQKMIRLPMPNADGTFVATSRVGVTRTHNFQPYY